MLWSQRASGNEAAQRMHQPCPVALQHGILPWPRNYVWQLEEVASSCRCSMLMAMSISWAEGDGPSLPGAGDTGLLSRCTTEFPEPPTGTLGSDFPETMNTF